MKKSVKWLRRSGWLKGLGGKCWIWIWKVIALSEFCMRNGHTHITEPACPEVQQSHQVIVILEDIVNNIEGVHQVHRRSVERVKATKRMKVKATALPSCQGQRGSRPFLS